MAPASISSRVGGGHCPYIIHSIDKVITLRDLGLGVRPQRIYASMYLTLVTVGVRMGSYILAGWP